MTNDELTSTINHLLGPLGVKAVFDRKWSEDPVPWKLIDITTGDEINIVPISAINIFAHFKGLDGILHSILHDVEDFHIWRPTSIYVKNPYLGSACLEEALIKRDLLYDKQ